MHRQRTHEGSWLTESLPWLPPFRLFAHDRIRHYFECWWMLGDQKFPSQEAFITRSFLCLLWCWDFQHSSSSFRCMLMTEAPHLLSLCLSLDVFGRILAIFLIGLTLLSLTYIMEFAVLSQSHKLSASWLAQPNHFFPVFASVSLKSMSSWDRGLSWLLSHLGNHDIYRLSRTGLGERMRMAEEALSNPWGGGWFNLSWGNSN